MAQLPIISIVGRQNVGKSTLFNTLTKTKKAIVDSYPGLTRDVLSTTITLKDYMFILTDTPGLDLEEKSALSESIIDNALNHLQKSSAIIFLLEHPEPASYDLELAKLLRKLDIPIIVAVNKMDSNKQLEDINNFFELGFADIIPISALNKLNIKLLIDKIFDNINKQTKKPKEPDLKISFVGKPNAGKSTLLNSLIGFDRAIVSDIPGTTRDSVDEEFLFKKIRIRVIDTAGIRKKRNITENYEYYSLTRTIDSIKQSDVVIHLIDAEQGLSETDKKISDIIVKERKPIIIAINKWDAIEKDTHTFDEFKKKLLFKFYKAQDFPIITISAKEKKRLFKLIDLTLELFEKANRKIDTPMLNKIIARLQDSQKIPQLGGKIRIYYATQIHTIPPQFKLFVNNKSLFRKDTIRYFEKALQNELDLKGIPIILHLEGKKDNIKKK